MSLTEKYCIIKYIIVNVGGVTVKRRNWQLIALLGFLCLWFLSNIESMFFWLLNFLAMLPLGIHAFAGNLLGFENWSKMVTFLNQPITILVAAILTYVILLKIVKFIDRILF